MGTREGSVPGASRTWPAALAWRVLLILPSLILFGLAPLPDRPWPGWLVLGCALVPTRLLAWHEGLSGLGDFLASLPFLSAGIAGVARFSLEGGASLAWLSAEALAGTVLLASLTSIVRARLRLAPSVLALVGIAIIAALAWVWSLDQALVALALEAILASYAIRSGMAGKRA